MEENVWTQRFMVVAAQSMFELVGMMNQVAHPMARVIYFGPNYGDYSNTELFTDEIRNATFIAVFDISPVGVVPIDDIEFTPSLSLADADLDTTNSA